MNLRSDYTVRILAPPEYGAFAGFTYPFHRPALLSPSETIIPVAAGIEAAGVPVALGLATIDRQAGSADLLSLFCQASHRRCGLGNALLSTLEAELVSRDVSAISCVWSTGAAGAEAISRILAGHAWTAPQPRMLLCQADAEFMKAPFFHPPIYPRIQRALPKAEIVPWREITNEDRESIVGRQRAAPWISDDLVPMLHEEGFEPLTSVAVRIDGEVVGWIITHRISPMVIRYTCSFIRRDYAQKGGMIMLYREVIWRQHERLPTGTSGIWSVPVDHREMADFVRRRMAPYLKSLVISQGSMKRLAA